MATGWPMKTTYANGDVYSASDVNDVTGTINLLTSSTLSLQAGKNAVINGGFDVWQRGTSIAYTAGVSYFADRWNGYRGALATGATFSRQSSSLTGILYCARMARDSGNTSTQPINTWYNLESQDSYKFAGQSIVLSFWARKGANYSSTSDALNVVLAYGTGTDQNMNAGFTGQTNITVGTATLTTSWQRFTFSGSVNSAATQLGFQIYYTPTGTAGAADYVEFTGVQLELGSTATTFSRAGGTIQGELAACQRYLPVIPAYSEVFGYCYATNSYVIGYKFPVTTRVAPTGITVNNIGSMLVYDQLNTPSIPSAITFNSGGTSTETGSILPAATGTAGNAGRIGLGSASIFFTGCEL